MVKQVASVSTANRDTTVVATCCVLYCMYITHTQQINLS